MIQALKHSDTLGDMMNIPINKNRSWIASLHESIGKLDENKKASIMEPAGKACAVDLLLLCERALGKKVSSVEDLVAGWNMVRDKRGLKGGWEFEADGIRGVFGECGCPLVRSGLMELHPVQCYCSQGMMKSVFAEAGQKPVIVEMKRSIGRGDDACEFVIRLTKE